MKTKYIIEVIEHHLTRYEVEASTPEGAANKFLRRRPVKLLSTSYYELAHDAAVCRADDPSVEVYSFDVDQMYPDCRVQVKS